MSFSNKETKEQGRDRKKRYEALVKEFKRILELFFGKGSDTQILDEELTSKQ